MINLSVLSLVTVALFLSFLLPPRFLLPASLASYVLIPVAYIPDVSLLMVVGTPHILMAAWLLRTMGRSRSSLSKRPTRLVLGALVVLFVSTAGTISFERSYAWSFSFLVLVIAPLLWAKPTEREAHLLSKTLISLSILLALYGAIEFLLNSNPFFGNLYSSGPYPINQTWSSYRITTTLGHPLNNMLFFGTALGVSLGGFIAQKGLLAAFGTMASLLGIFMTLSRTGVIVCGVVVLLSLFMNTRNGVQSKAIMTRISVAVVSALGVYLISTSTLLSERNSSSDGSASTAARDQLFEISLNLIGEHGIFGSGPGTSNLAMLESGYKLVLENSALQLFVSTGPIFTALILVLFIRSFISFRNHGNFDAALGLAAICSAMLGFNWLEAIRPGMVLIGALIVVGNRISSDAACGESLNIERITKGQLGSID